MCAQMEAAPLHASRACAGGDVHQAMTRGVTGGCGGACLVKRGETGGVSRAPLDVSWSKGSGGKTTCVRTEGEKRTLSEQTVKEKQFTVLTVVVGVVVFSSEAFLSKNFLFLRQSCSRCSNA